MPHIGGQPSAKKVPVAVGVGNFPANTNTNTNTNDPLTPDPHPPRVFRADPVGPQLAAHGVAVADMVKSAAAGGHLNMNMDMCMCGQAPARARRE